MKGAQQLGYHAATRKPGRHAPPEAQDSFRVFPREQLRFDPQHRPVQHQTLVAILRF
jgi:hypothetical protein